MTSPHHHRKAPPVPTARDLRLWRDVIAEAGKCAERPASDAQALYRASVRARKAVMPVGQQHGASPFVDLNRTCEAWWQLTPEQRAAGAKALADKAALCRAILNGENDGPERPLRKDIFE